MKLPFAKLWSRPLFVPSRFSIKPRRSIYKNTRIIHSLDEGDRKLHTFKNDSLIEVVKSEKTKNYLIIFSRIAGLRHKNYWFNDHDFRIQLGIGFRTVQGENQIVFYSYRDQLPLFEDDCFTILFKNRTALTFVTNTPVSSVKDNVMEGFTALFPVDLQKLLKHEPIGWHYFSYETSQTFSGSFSEKEKQVFQEMATCYYQVLRKYKQLQ